MRISDWSSDVCSSDRPVRAQQTVIQIENVRTEYARVLRAEPVYQTLRATAMVEECEDAAPADGAEPRRGPAKVVGAVKDALTPNSADAAPQAGQPPRDGSAALPTERASRRPAPAHAASPPHPRTPPHPNPPPPPPPP